MTIKGILMAGAAICTLAAAPALAKDLPHVHVMAMHKGGPVVKTRAHSRATTAVTSTASVSTGISTATAYKVKTPLYGAYYAFLSNTATTLCEESAKQKVALSTKKTVYASLSTGSATATGFCTAHPTTFYGPVYDLSTKAAAGKTDTFTSTLTGKFKEGKASYAGKLILPVTVSIGS